MAPGWGVPAAGWGSGSRGGITGKPEHKNRGRACSVVHLRTDPDKPEGRVQWCHPLSSFGSLPCRGWRCHTCPHGSRVRPLFLLEVYGNPICGLKCSCRGCRYRIYNVASKYRREGKLSSPLMFASVNCRPELSTLLIRIINHQLSAVQLLLFTITT